MFRIYLTKSMLVGFCLTLATLAWLAVYGYQTTRQLIFSSQWVAHTHDVLYHAEQILAIASSIEVGQRGFCITGNEEFLEPYHKARNEVNSHYHALTVLITDNKQQQLRMTELRGALDNLLMFSSSAIESRKIDFERAKELNASMQGKRVLDRIRVLINDFQTEEKRLLRERTLNNENQIVKFKVGFVSLLFTIFVVLIVVFVTINSNLRKREQSEDQVRKASAEIKDLYDNAPCGYHSLDEKGVFVDINATLLKWLGYSENEVVGRLRFADLISSADQATFAANYPILKEKGVVQDLEFILKRKDGTQFPIVLNSTAIYNEQGEFVKSRSNTFDNTVRKKSEIRIKELNHELEAFTYSVSHDLRAPLRSIDGYARILKEDYGSILDDEGKRLIAVVMNNAKRMGQLIDDLLEFSRLGRKDIAKSNIDMTRLVQNAVEELMVHENGRNVEFKINDLLPAVVDVDMVRQVWVNLLSNALKYSGKTPQAVIEVKSEYLPNEICYQVKDNGVGFDMQYKGKLFGVFQRLHKIQDFPGTGVGLAIVKRIIDRHNGRVWAEGKLNEGASFYFTIPKLNGEQ